VTLWCPWAFRPAETFGWPQASIQEGGSRLDTGEAPTIDRLARRGFTDGFRVVDGGLQVLSSGKPLRPDDVVIREVYRFEGVSDPDDMAVVYAIESSTGVRGTLIDAFGVYADPAKAAALAHVRIRNPAAP
jgi:hypothetical protein